MGFKSNTELIIELKAAINDKGIGQAELMKMMEDRGHPIAKTTIQRLYREGSEINDSFRYNDTLLPLAELLLGNEPEVDPIVELQGKIDALTVQITELTDIAVKSIEFMKEQISLKDTRMERKDEWIQQLMNENKRLNEDVCKLLERCNVCGKGQVTSAGATE